MEHKTKCSLCEREIDGMLGRWCCRCDQIRHDAFTDSYEAGEV